MMIPLLTLLGLYPVPTGMEYYLYLAQMIFGIIIVHELFNLLKFLISKFSNFKS